MSVKTILVVGGTSDIGVAIACKFAEHGWNIELWGRNEQELEIIVNDISIRYRVSAVWKRIDVLNLDSAAVAIEEISLLPDVVVSAVGLLSNQSDDQRSHASTTEILRSNFEGPAMVLCEFASRFTSRGYGTLVGISSVAGDRGRGSNYTYGSAKAGFTAFLSGLRNELFASGVHVMTVVPGFVRTKMTEGMKLSPLLASSPKYVAERVYMGVNKRSDLIYVSRRWRVIMFFIKAIPEVLFKRLKL